MNTFARTLLLSTLVVMLTAGQSIEAQPTYPESEFLKNLPPVVATIQGVPITADTYRKAIRLAAMRQATNEIEPGGELPALTSGQEFGVLRLLVETQAMSVLAQSSGLTVSDEDLEKAIAIDAQRAGGMQALQARVTQSGNTFEDFKKMRKSQLIQRLYARSAVNDVTVSPEEVQAQYKELRAQGELDSPERASIRHILVRAADTTDLAWEAAKEGITVAHKRIVEDGEDFGLVASQLSDEKATAGNGGKVMLPRTGKSNEFQDRAFSLEIGQVSEPFKSKVGWHIIVVEQRIPAGHLAYDEVAKRIHDQILGARRVEALRKHVLTAMSSMDIKYHVEIPDTVSEDEPDATSLDEQNAIDALLNDAS